MLDVHIAWGYNFDNINYPRKRGVKMEIDDVVDMLCQVSDKLDKILTQLEKIEKTQEEIERKIK